MKWCTEGGQRPKPLEGAAAAAAAERGVGGGIGLLFMRVSHTRGRGGGWRVSIQVSSSNCNTDVWFKLRYGFCVQTAIQLLPLGLSPRLSPASLSSHLNLQTIFNRRPPPPGQAATVFVQAAPPSARRSSEALQVAPPSSQNCELGMGEGS